MSFKTILCRTHTKYISDAREHNIRILFPLIVLRVYYIYMYIYTRDTGICIINRTACTWRKK